MGKRILGQTKIRKSNKLMKEKNAMGNIAKTFGKEYLKQSRKNSKAKSCQDNSEVEPQEWYWTALAAIIYFSPLIFLYCLFFL